MTRSAAGSSRSREQNDHATTVELSGRVAGGGDEVGRAVGRLDRREVGEQSEDATGAAQRRPPARRPTAECADRDPVLAREPDVAERRRGPLGEQRAWPAGPVAIDADASTSSVIGDVLLLDEQLHEELLEPGVDVPVELAKVVAEGVFAVVGELDRLAALDAPPATLEPAADRRAHQQQQPLELAEERLVEDGRVDLARTGRPGGSRPAEHRATAASARGRRGPGVEARSLGHDRRGYSTVGTATASRIARTTASLVMPSASPSKLRMIRWRSDGSATARMSSVETLKRPSSSA